MDAILKLFEVNFHDTFLSVIILLIGLKALASLLEWASKRLGLETKWIRKQRKEHELLIQTAQSLAELRETHSKDMERSDRHDEEISRDISKLTRMFVEKEIDDLRWEILDFSSSLSCNRSFSRESFDHIMRIYHKYEAILRENGMENGLVEESIKFIQEEFRKLLENGIQP